MTDIVPPHRFDDPDAQRLAGALDAMATKFMATIDAACKLRDAPNAAHRQRSIAKTALEQAAMAGLAALAHAKAGKGNNERG